MIFNEASPWKRQRLLVNRVLCAYNKLPSYNGASTPYIKFDPSFNLYSSLCVLSFFVVDVVLLLLLAFVLFFCLFIFWLYDWNYRNSALEKLSFRPTLLQALIVWFIKAWNHSRRWKKEKRKVYGRKRNIVKRRNNSSEGYNRPSIQSGVVLYSCKQRNFVNLDSVWPVWKINEDALMFRPVYGRNHLMDVKNVNLKVVTHEPR